MFPDSEPDYPKKTSFLFAVNCCVLAFAYPAIWLPVSSWNDFAASEKYLLFLSPIILVIFYFLENRLPSVIRLAEICFFFFPLLFFVRIFLEALSSSYVEILGFDFVFNSFYPAAPLLYYLWFYFFALKKPNITPKTPVCFLFPLFLFLPSFFVLLQIFLYYCLDLFIFSCWN